MADFRNYDPSRVSFTFKGFRITGFMDGTFIECERSSDGFTKHVGALGDVTRVRNLDRTGSVQLHLLAQSPSNDILQDLASDDEQFGLEFGPIQILDHNGNMECHASIAWIKKMPKVERAKDAGSVVWHFECADLEILAGGNVV